MKDNNLLAPRPQLGAMLHITPQGEQSPARTYVQFTDLVQNLDALGFDEAWVTEHHFTPHSLTPSPLLMMGHFLAHTQRLKLGAAAVLLGFHNPIEVAENLAVLNTLHPNRVLCGFAKGGPFESQNATFKANGELSRARMEEAIPALLALFKTAKHTHLGQHYQWRDVALHPQSPFTNSQFLLASSTQSTLNLAAKNNLGLMAAQFWDVTKIAHNRTLYQQMHPLRHKPDMMVARGLFIDDDPQVAQDKALAHIHAFRTQKSQLWGQHQGPLHAMDDAQLLSRMLCGNLEQVRQQTQSLLDLGVTRLGLNPLTNDHECRWHQLERFYQEVWRSLMSPKMPPNLEVG